MTSRRLNLDLKKIVREKKRMVTIMSLTLVLKKKWIRMKVRGM